MPLIWRHAVYMALTVWLKFKPCAPRQCRFKYRIVPDLPCFRPTKARTRRSKKNAAGPTNWLSVPLQTGFTQRHQIDVGGSDRQVSYRFTATFSPAGRGVMKGSGNNDLSLRSYVGYRHKAIDVYNDMGFDYYNARKSNFGAVGRHGPDSGN